MTVSAQTPVNSSTGNGVTTVFPYAFKVIAAADLEVTVDGVVKTLTTDYTVSGAGDDAGGNVTFITAPASGTTVVRRRNMALTRTTDYQVQGDLRSDVLNPDQDAPILMLQQIDERVARSLRYPAGEAAADELPAAADRASMFLAFDADGNPMASSGSGAPASAFMATVLDDTTAAAARATLGAAADAFTQTGTGATARTVDAKLKERVTLEDFGATGDGVTDDTAEIAAALATGKRVFGDPSKTYAVTGAITLAANAWLEDVSLKQLAPAAASSLRTIASSGVNNITLRNVKVNRNGDGTAGAIGTAAGIWLSGGSGHLLDRVEVYGDDMGSGIVIEGNASNFICRDLYVHDIDYSLGSSPGDDRVQGVWFNNCTDFQVIGGRVMTLGGNFGSGATTRYSRGWVFGGCSRYSVQGARVRDVDQGFDNTGSAGNQQFSFDGCIAYQAYSYGFKVANSGSDGRFTGCVAHRCGYAGFVVNGPSEAGTPNPENITFVGCLAKDAGYNGAWTANNPAGFLILQGSFLTTYPRGIRFIACEAIDEQGSPTMVDGFRNQIGVSGANHDFNEAVHCTVRGATTNRFNGMNAPHVRCKRSAVQSVPSGAYTSVNWTAEDADYAGMHDTASNTELVTIRRTGLYSCKSQLSFAANATGSRRLRFLVNGVTLIPTEFAEWTPTSGSPCYVFGAVDIHLKAGDTVRVEAFQNSGGALDVRDLESFFSVTEIGAYGAA